MGTRVRRIVRRHGTIAVLAWASIALVTAACAPAPSGAGPGEGPYVVSVRLDGAYEYATQGPVLSGDLELGRGSAGLTSVRGEVTVPGRGLDRARVRFDLSIDGRVASGSVRVVDPAAGIDAETTVVAGGVAADDGSVSGSAEWTRLWRVVELRPYRLEWEVRDGTGTVPTIPALPVAEEGSFTAITYNVAGLIEPISGSEPATLSPLIGGPLDAYDVAILQEDFFYRDLVVRDSTYPYGSEPEPLVWGSDRRRPSAIVRSGLEQYSRLPFDEYRHIAWEGCFGLLPTDGGAADCLSLKGFAVSRLHLAEGVSIDLYNLHAEAGSTPEDYAWSARDFEQLADYVIEHSAGRAVLLGGDLNLSPSNPIDAAVWTQFLEVTGLQDACDVTVCTVDPITIDRFAVRAGDDVDLTISEWDRPSATFSTPDGRGLSDHDPTVVRVDWAKR